MVDAQSTISIEMTESKLDRWFIDDNNILDQGNRSYSTEDDYGNIVSDADTTRDTESS
jgi:hypothetical protein